jgi:hypothetical protein
MLPHQLALELVAQVLSRPEEVRNSHGLGREAV